jgi:hypothetical protein
MSPNEIEAVTDLFLVSNTPPFLYRSLRRSPAFESLVKRPQAELRAMVYDADAQDAAAVEATAIGYSALVALLAVADGGTRQELSTRKWHRLSWAPWFVTLEKAARPWATNSKTIEVPTSPAVVLSSVGGPQTSSTTDANAAPPPSIPSIDPQSDFTSTTTNTTLHE